jgi:hypothetical protein
VFLWFIRTWPDKKDIVEPPLFREAETSGDVTRIDQVYTAAVPTAPYSTELHITSDVPPCRNDLWKPELLVLTSGCGHFLGFLLVTLLHGIE